MKRSIDDIPQSCKGKHDFELQSNLKKLFNEKGINPIISVERRRGRIKIECKEGDYLLTSSIVRSLHPDFITNSYENGFVLFTDFLA